jgi:hypothetical protein
MSPEDIAEFGRDWSIPSCHKVNQQRGTTAPLWQHQFWSGPVWDRREFNPDLEPVRFNPTRVARSRYATPFALPSAFITTWLTTASLTSVNRPVRAAVGSVAEGLLKYDAMWQPR